MTTNSSAVTQDDIFELDGVGKTTERRSALRLARANMPRFVRNMLERHSKRQKEIEESYARGYDEGFSVGSGLWPTK